MHSPQRRRTGNTQVSKAAEGGPERFLAKTIIAAKAAARRVASKRAAMESAAKRSIVAMGHGSMSSKQRKTWKVAIRAEHRARTALASSKDQAGKLKRILRHQLRAKKSKEANPSQLLSTRGSHHHSLQDVARELVGHGMHRMMVTVPRDTRKKEAAYRTRLERLAIATRQTRKLRRDTMSKVRVAETRIRRAKRRHKREASITMKLKKAARIQEHQVHTAKLMLKQMPKDRASRGVADHIRQDELHLKNSVLRLGQKAASHAQRAKHQAGRLRDAIAMAEHHKKVLHHIKSKETSQAEEFRIMSEAYGGIVVTSSPALPKNPSGKRNEAAEVLNRLAEDERKAASHEQAAADARALETKERTRAADEMSRVHKLSEYLRDHFNKGSHHGSGRTVLKVQWP